MAAESYVHVVSKANNAEHHVLPLPTGAPSPLASGHVRARPALLGLTANNLSYARMGGPFHWWKAYPVPESLPTPYNDQEQYGIVPAWGYGEVMESMVDGLLPGTLIWGFWPLSSMSVDLKLAPTEPAGDYIESSEGRKDLWNLYQRYTVRDPQARLATLNDSQVKSMALEGIFKPVGGASYVLNKFVFGEPPCHPMNAGEWTSRDADLSKALVVSLAAAGKTAMYFNDAVLNDRSSGPLGLLGVTSDPQSLGLVSEKIPVHAVSYQKATSPDTMDWIRSLNAERAVIVDFGGRSDSLIQVKNFLETEFGAPVVTIIGVGSEPTVMSREALGAYVKRNASLSNRVQMNASSINDAAIEKVGVAKFFGDQERGYDDFVRRGNTEKLRLHIGSGVKGDAGIEGGWTQLCSQSVPSGVGLAYRL